jgi:hypothetical protein
MVNGRLLTVCLFCISILLPATGKSIEESDAISIYTTVAYKDVCDRKIPGFKNRTDDLYNTWRKGKEKYIRMAEEEIHKSKEMNPQNENNWTKKNQSDLESECDDLVITLGSYGKPHDPRLSTPQGTWELYISSLKNGDRTTALTCLNSDARRIWKKALKEMTKQQMLDLSELIKEFHMAYELSEDMQVGFAVRHDGIGSEIYFTKDRDGWHISQM